MRGKIHRSKQRKQNENQASTLTNIVAHEEIIGIRGITADAEELDKVMELAMDIAAYSDRAANGLDVPLLHKDRPRLLT